MTSTAENAPAAFRSTKKFKVCYGDPPWMRAQLGKRGAINHYNLMSTEAIKSMPIADLMDDNSTLLLWTTNAALPEALEVMRAWGFEYKGNAVWDKYFMGLGNYFRGSHELLLHGIRGSAPWKFHGQRSTLLLPRTTHSTKPAEMIPLIERVLDGPYLELFARQRPNSHKDWSVWGNEAPGGSDIRIPGYPVPEYSVRAGIADHGHVDGDQDDA
ncbi:MT-A70 family methyltransferase [Microbacterium sp. ASV81]|uniref:MT-A70 family methyltransferase n=1 Tax=Microbacterium capsulatum TaxID=3041921 RepID=A0ABU0XI47_9MICO|nr:MT-A70 family methyltransferase [Microbacterium sp. ASV81]MDQ4214761.1 MT-A70 family methyltransferase [Microbacterium sp. ASV81]